jgi:hypothetical protein
LNFAALGRGQESLHHLFYYLRYDDVDVVAIANRYKRRANVAAMVYVESFPGINCFCSDQLGRLSFLCQE